MPCKILECQYSFNDGGEEEKQGTGENKIIHGDNLEALKALLPAYEGKIKCIYIDPPYNTGNNGRVYDDNDNHDKWLCDIYPRLMLLRQLLADDGAIFISIDDNEQANLKLVMDEIFGGLNFIGQFIWEKKNVMQNDARFLSVNHEYIIAYRKTKKLVAFNLLPRTKAANKRYTNPDNDPRGPWASFALTAKSGNINNIYGITFPNGVSWKPNAGTFPRLTKSLLMAAYHESRLWFGKTGQGIPRLKKYLSEVKKGMVSNSILYNAQAGSTQKAKTQLKQILNTNVFDTPKPAELIEIFIRLASGKDAVILDAFAGSGTTAHAVLNLNKDDGGSRKFILIEMGDYAGTITAERIKRVIQGYANKKGTGGSFNYYSLKPG